MTGIQIFMIVFGVVLIIISYIISEKFTSKGEVGINSKELSDKLDVTLESIDKQLEIATNGVLEDADNKLSKLSNDKIMAVHEYSEQVLEKINQNHNEVVFLYDMLNTKETELKSLMKEINDVKRNVNKETVTSNKNTASNSDKNKKTPAKKNEKVVKNEKENKVSSEIEKLINMEDYTEFVEQNYNEQILKLYESGKSVMEISKTLGIGQGEVKLVINLYNGVNGK
jgi:hypothetical protein